MLPAAQHSERATGTRGASMFMPSRILFAGSNLLGGNSNSRFRNAT